MFKHWLAVVLVVAIVSCTDEEVPQLETTVSALDSRITPDGYTEVNVARGGSATSSGAISTQPASFINDGRRGAPWISSMGAYAFWQSSNPSTVYNCNYGGWWTRVSFTPPPGTVCPFGGCPHKISEIDLFSLQDNYSTGADPSIYTTTTYYGNVDFHLQYCPVGTLCSSNGAGWVEPPGGYVTFNNKAWRKVTFAPVWATAVRAAIDCGQIYRAQVVELEAWEQLTPPACTKADIQNDGLPATVGDDNSNAAKFAESDRFWWRYFGAGWRDNDEVAEINRVFAAYGNEEWEIGRRTSALVQMYDLLAPVDFERAKVYLDRLRDISNALLANRDDYLGRPVDVDHGRVMRSWGAYHDNAWRTEILTAGLYTYPMAAFARRIAEHPDWFCLDYRRDAVKFTTAVIETYFDYREDMHFTDSDPWAYYLLPDGVIQTWNEGFSLVKALAEVASAADSALYRATAESYGNAALIYYATQEAPRFIAKNARFFAAKLPALQDPTSSMPWYYWSNSARSSTFIENSPHGQFTLSSMAVMYDRRGALDALLSRYGYAERVGSWFTPTMFTRLANGFLLKIWKYDYTPGSMLRNLISHHVDGSYNPTLTDNDNEECAGYLTLAALDHWVFVRCRDSVFNPNVPGSLREDNHAAMLRYR